MLGPKRWGDRSLRTGTSTYTPLFWRHFWRWLVTKVGYVSNSVWKSMFFPWDDSSSQNSWKRWLRFQSFRYWNWIPANFLKFLGTFGSYSTNQHPQAICQFDASTRRCGWTPKIWYPKLTWHWKIYEHPIFNRNYIFIHGGFSIFMLVFGGGYPDVFVPRRDMRFLLLMFSFFLG